MPYELLELEELLSPSSVSVCCEGGVDGGVSTSESGGDVDGGLSTGFSGVAGRGGGVVGLVGLVPSLDLPLVVGGSGLGDGGCSGGWCLPFLS